jgi:hypothetical protein
MAQAGVPPPPLNSPSGSYYWLEWYTNLTNFLNGTNIPWSNINLTGADIADIPTRLHNSLTGIQGGSASMSVGGAGNAYHLLGFGYVDAAATAPGLISGWTVAHTATGVYTITHNLGLAPPDVMAGATTNTTGISVAWVDTSNANTLIVHTATTGTNTPFDSSFSFWISKL